MKRRVSEYTKVFGPIGEQGIKRLGRPEWEDDYKAKMGAFHAEVAVPHDTEVARALADPDLSGPGRAKAIRRAKLTYLERLDGYQRQLVDPLRARAATAEAEASGRVTVRPPTDPAERLAFELRQREIRDSLRGLDSLLRWNVYLTTTDPEVRLALESAPPVLGRRGRNAPPEFEPFIDPEKVMNVRAARLQREAPEVVEEIEALRGLADLYAGVINTCRQMILEDMPADEAAIASPARPTSTGDPIADAGLIAGR